MFDFTKHIVSVFLIMYNRNGMLSLQYYLTRCQELTFQFTSKSLLSITLVTLDNMQHCITTTFLAYISTCNTIKSEPSKRLSFEEDSRSKLDKSLTCELIEAKRNTHRSNVAFSYVKLETYFCYFYLVSNNKYNM